MTGLLPESRKEKAGIVVGVEGVPVIRGTVREIDNRVCLDNVPVVTPNGDVVVPSLSFNVSQSGESRKSHHEEESEENKIGGKIKQN